MGMDVELLFLLSSSILKSSLINTEIYSVAVSLSGTTGNDNTSESKPFTGSINLLKTCVLSPFGNIRYTDRCTESFTALPRLYSLIFMVNESSAADIKVGCVDNSDVSNT